MLVTGVTYVNSLECWVLREVHCGCLLQGTRRQHVQLLCGRLNDKCIAVLETATGSGMMPGDIAMCTQSHATVVHSARTEHKMGMKYVSVYVRMYITYIGLHMYNIHTHIHTYIHTYIHTHTHTHSYMHTYIHTHINTYTRTHTHTHTKG
jgi:hypothetical protein